jgi:plasmid maintenance system killer protein
MAESEATSAQGVAAEESASLNEDEVQQLDARAQLTGPVAYRHYWGAKNGQWRLHLSWGGMSAANQVYVAIHEGNFIGGARYTLHNVAPYNGGVSIWVNIEWSSPINLYADYYVV